MPRGRNCTQTSHTKALLSPTVYCATQSGPRCYPRTEEHGVDTVHNLKWKGPSRKGVLSQGPRVCLGYMKDLWQAPVKVPPLRIVRVKPCRNGRTGGPEVSPQVQVYATGHGHRPGLE